MSRASGWVVGMLLALAGCPRTPAEQADRQSARATPVACARQSFEAPAGRGFVHKRSTLLAAALTANHFAQDVIALPGAVTTVEGKFSYADVGKDLEDEPITVQLGDCRGWSVVSRGRTDDDGRLRSTFEAPTRPGTYALVQVVDGDGSMARSTLTVATTGARLVVFDLDGTLTVSDGEISRDVLDEHLDRAFEGDYDPQTYPGGAELTRAWAERGYQIVYLTGRPYWLLEHTRQWLHEQGYAPGHLHTTDRHRDVVPHADGVGAFKAEYLGRLHERGYRIVAAYGNAPTDIQAYAEVGIDKARTFIIGPHAGEHDTRAIEGDYRLHLSWVLANVASL